MAAKIRIDPAFANLLPHRDDTELEAMILADGRVFDPLIVWAHNNILLDGHRRERIMRRHPHLKAPKPIIVGKEWSRQEAENFAIDHQRNKRNLTDSEDKYLLGKKYVVNKPQSGKHSDSSSAKVAEDEGVSQRTVHRAADYFEAVKAVPEVAEPVLKEKVSATTADLEKLAELPKAKRKRAARAIASGEAKSIKGAIEQVSEPESDTIVRDSLKGPVPESLHEVFDAVDEFRSLMKLLSDCGSRVKELAEQPGGKRMDLQETTRLLHQARVLLRYSMPHTECPKCRRKLDKKCPACNGAGWIHETMFKTSASDQDKHWLERRSA